MQSLGNPFVLCIKSVQSDTRFTYWYYDSLRRNNKIVFSPKAGAAGSKKLYTVLGYKDVTLTTSEGKSKKATTGLVSEYTNKFGSTGTTSTYSYTYDNGGNILTEIENGVKHTYVYNTIWKDKHIR